MFTPKNARKLLGLIRLVNGALALGAPKRLVKTFGAEPEENGAAIYALRLFGVRTILLGLHLLFAEGDVLHKAIRDALPIHASDTAAAAMAGLTGELPPRASATATAISSFNTMLAWRARHAS